SPHRHAVSVSFSYTSFTLEIVSCQARPPTGKVAFFPEIRNKTLVLVCANSTHLQVSFKKKKYITTGILPSKWWATTL
ncbi:MAG TPA: hypothetical protein VGO47_10485, partial [Chlamydiales bacterium]|nr:hypothetical protein [Chlamydiales bacterium]